MNEYSKVVEMVRNQSKIKNVDTRVEEDMEKKYVLILANGDIVITNNGKDEKIGNTLTDYMIKL